MQLRETALVGFGDPPAGTPVMVAALYFPLKVPIWDGAGQAEVSYYGPAALASRYGLSADLAAIDPVTGALIARWRRYQEPSAPGSSAVSGCVCTWVS